MLIATGIILFLNTLVEIFGSKTNTKSFVLFADLNRNGTFEGDPDNCSIQYSLDEDGCVSRYNIQRGNYVSDIRVTGHGVSDLGGKQKADIVFVRPNPDAKITVDDQSYESVAIILSDSAGDKHKKVVVQSNGLIYIDSKYNE